MNRDVPAGVDRVDGGNPGASGSRDPRVVTLRQVRKTFATPAGPLAAVDGIDLDVASGEFVAIAGPSG